MAALVLATGHDGTTERARRTARRRQRKELVLATDGLGRSKARATTDLAAHRWPRHIDHHGVVLEIPTLSASTILLVEVGSTAHGTGIPGGEDHDELGVVFETPERVIGLDEIGFATVMYRTQPEGSRSGPGDTDRTLHSLRRFVRLAASGNPLDPHGVLGSRGARHS